MRHLYQGTFKDLNGAVVGSSTTSNGVAGTVSVFIAGTSQATAADVYAAASGGTAVASVSTDTYGHFEFFVDDSEYTPAQLFDITLSHAQFNSKTYEYIKIIPDDPYMYYVDGSVTDQGAATTLADRSLKDLIDSVVAVSSTFIIPNSGTGSTTTYTLTTSETVTATINLDIENGAIFDGAGTLTLDRPEQIKARPNQQIFGSSITVTFTNPGVVPVGWWGADPDATATDQTAMAACISAAAAGSTIYFRGGTQYYSISDSLTISKALTLVGDGESSEIRQATDAKSVFSITASNVTIRDLYLRGTGAPTDDYSSSSTAITATGTDGGAAVAPTYISKIKIQNCYIYNWKMRGIHLIFVEDFDIVGNHAETITYAGISVHCCRYGRITGNLVEDIKCASNSSGNGYGIVASRTSGVDLVRYPRCSDINIGTNTVRKVLTWEGIDTHGGQRINVTGNDIYNCPYGIVMAPSTNAAGPKDCVVSSNTIDSGVSDGTAVYGVSFSGDSTNSKYGSGVISNNNIFGFGTDANESTNGAIYIHTVRGISVTGNNLVDCTSPGIMMKQKCYGFTLTGNTFIDVWSELDADANGIRVGDSTHNYGYIGGNSFIITGASSATYVLTRAIFIEDTATQHITVGKNYSEAPTYIKDDGECTGRGLSSENTVTTTTGEDTLKSIIVTTDVTDIKDGSSTLLVGIGENLRVTAAGTKTGANGDKTIKFYFGSTTFTFNAQANDVVDWRVEVLINITSATAQRITWVGYNGATATSGFEPAAETMSGDITMKVTGECGHESDIITQKIWVIERI